MKLKILFIIFIFLISSSCCFASEDVNEIVEQNMGINSLSSSSNNDNLIDTQQEYLDTHLERNVVDYFNSNITEKKFCEVNEEENLEVLNQENYPNSKAYLDVSVDNHSFGEVIEIKGYLRNSSNILSNKKITIQLSNNSYVCKTDYNGYFTYNITKYEEGLNNVTVIFNDENYNESAFRQFVVFKNISSEDNRIQNDYKANNSLNIPRGNNTKLNTIIVLNSLTLVGGENANFSADIFDEYGNPVNGGNVVFKINGVTIKDENGNVQYVNVINGIASMNYYIPLNWISRQYNISSVYGGTNIYESCRTNNYTLEISKRTTNILISTQEQAKSSETITLTAILSDQHVDEDGIIIFKFNGNTIRDKFYDIVKVNVENHIAQYNYILPLGLYAGTYNLTAVYSSKYYERAENVTFITIKKLNTKIIILTTDTFRENPHIEAELYDEYDNLLVGSINYTIKINGVLIKEGIVNTSEIDTYIERIFPPYSFSVFVEVYENNKYNYSIDMSLIPFYFPLTSIETDNLYTLSTAQIMINMNNVVSNSSINVFLDNNLIYNSTINTTSLEIEQYIPIDFGGEHKLKVKIYNNTSLIRYASKNITIESRYIYVNSEGDSNSDGTNINNPTSLEKALQITSPEKILYLTTTYDMDIYNMSNIIINNNTTNSHHINIMGEKGKQIIFDGHLMNRLFVTERSYNLTLVNTICINGYGYRGGLFVNQGNLNLINNTFINNYAFLSSGIVFNKGNLSLIKNKIYNTKILNYTRDLTNNSGITANGGVIDSYNGDIVLMENVFNNNVAHYGGVINTFNSTLTFINNTFYNNSVKYSGGVIYLNNSTSFSCNNLFKNNCAKYGSVGLINSSISYSINDTYINNVGGKYGALYILNSTYNFIESLFKNNNATYGGSVYIENSNLLVDNSLFYNNKALSHGASVSSINSNIKINSTIFKDDKVKNGVGGSVYIEKTNSYINNSEFKNNRAKLGGAITILDNNLNILENSHFSCNNAYEGGAIYTSKANLYINNTIFEKNNATNHGGAVYSILTNSLSVEDSIFQFNEAQEYSNIYTIDSFTNINNNQIFSNNIKSVLVDKLTGNINENFWGTNNPNFEIITNNITPNSWKILENDTFINEYNNEYFNTSNDKINFTITTNNNNSVTTLNPKKAVNIFFNDILTTINENIIINITFSEKITSNVIFQLVNGTIITKSVNNNNQTQINYKTSNYEKLDRITIIIPETNNYSLVTKNLNIFVQNNISYFNLMDYNLVTPVKDQFTSPSCWAFASLSALESAIVKEHNLTYDFSENHLKNIINKYSIFGTDTEANMGSSLLRPLNYMVSWFDPILENEDSFFEKSTISPNIPSVYHVQDAILIESSVNEDIGKYKDLLLKYGAIYTDFNSEGRCDINIINYNNETINNTINYYNFEEKNPTHAITIIGWDDKYSKYNFNNSGHIPEEDGAFIIKNSWGTINGVNGINYVSYYDKSLAVMGSIVFSVENKNNYTSIYQHETCSVTTINTNSSIAYIANSFQSARNEEIQAVGTFFNDASNYTVSIYKNGVEHYIQEGQVLTPSYKTIQLNEYIPLNKGDNFTAIIQIATGVKTKIVVQDSLGMTSKNITNESFISFDGVNWINLYDYQVTACLKVYTGNSNITTTNNRITNKTINMTLNDNRPTSIPGMINNQKQVFNYSLAHYIIKVPTTRIITDNNISENRTLNRTFLLINDESTVLTYNDYVNGCLLDLNGNFISNNYNEIEGIYFEENIQGNYIEVHVMFNITDDLNKLDVISYSNVNIMQGQIQQIILTLNDEVQVDIGVFLPQYGFYNYFDEYIITQFVFDNQSIERTEHIHYYSFDEGIVGQTYIITKTKIDNETYLNWTNNTNNFLLNYNPIKIAFNTLYLNDLFADMISSILNVTWERNNFTIILSGESNNTVYIHTVNSTMGMDIQGETDNKLLFRFLTTYLLSFWEEKSITRYVSAECALTKIMNALEDNSYRIFEENNTIIFVVNDDTNTTIVIDGETGIVSDFLQYDGNVYHGTVSDDQHNLVGFEVDSPEAELERLVGSTIMASSGYLLAVPFIGPELALAVGFCGAVICADGCGLTNFSQWGNNSRWANFGWDVATSIPYCHVLGAMNKIQKLSGVVSKLEDIDRTLVNIERSIKNSDSILIQKIYEQSLYIKEIICDELFADGINVLTQDIIMKYYEFLHLNIPTKKFTEYFNFLFEMDKDLLFEGSHLSQANIEIFCKRINQLPSGVTKVLYMGYGFSKTIAEKSTQFIIIKISGRKEIVDEMFSSIDSVKYSNINTKRLKYFETKNKEYFYVEESSYDRILGCKL